MPRGREVSAAGAKGVSGELRGCLVSFISLLIPVKRNGELCGQSGLGIHRQPAPAWLFDLFLAVLWKTFMAPFHVDPA